MCFNQPISFVFGSLGILASYNLYKKKAPLSQHIHFLFYSGMEFLQFFQYFYIDSCSAANSSLTQLAYVYIWLQPIMYNTFYLLTTPRHAAIFKYNIIFSLFVFVWAMDRMFFHYVHQYDRRDEINGGTITCTYRGNKHLYWHFDLASNRGVETNYLFYLTLICLPSFWTEHALYLNGTFLSGLSLAYYYTRNIDETVSFWCLLSLPYLLISLIL